MSRLYKDSEQQLVTWARRLTEDELAEQMKLEIDHLDYLESTGRHKERIAKQRRRVEVLTNVAAEES